MCGAADRFLCVFFLFVVWCLGVWWLCVCVCLLVGFVVFLRMCVAFCNRLGYGVDKRLNSSVQSIDGKD